MGPNRPPPCRRSSDQLTLERQLLARARQLDLDLTGDAAGCDRPLLERPVGVPLVPLDEAQQERRVGLERLEGHERDVQDDGVVGLGLGAGVPQVDLVAGREQPDLTDHITGIVGEREGEVGGDDAALLDHEQRVGRITRGEQGLVLGELTHLDVLGQRPAVGGAQAAEQDVVAEQVADALALLVTVREGKRRHREDSSWGGTAADGQLWLHNLTESRYIGQ